MQTTRSDEETSCSLDEENSEARLEADEGQAIATNAEIETASQPRRRRVPRANDAADSFPRIPLAVQEIVEGKSAQGFPEFISRLSFRSTLEQIAWRPDILTCTDDTEAVMADRVKSIVQHIRAIDDNLGMLQHIELARQMEVISAKRSQHVYSTIREVCGPGEYSL